MAKKLQLLSPLIGPQGEKGDPGETGPQGPPGAEGKSAYAYARDGGYTGSEASFAAKLASDNKVFTVTISGNAESGYSVDKTAADLLNAAHNADRPMICNITGGIMAIPLSRIVSLGGVQYRFIFQTVHGTKYTTVSMLAGSSSTSILNISVSSGEYAEDTTLQALTINGMVYDGTKAVSVMSRLIRVTVSGDAENGYTTNIPFEDICAAIEQGCNVVCLLESYGALMPMSVPPTEDGVGFMLSIGVLGGVSVIIAPDNSVIVEESYTSITIGDQTWAGDIVDFTPTIEAMISDGVEEGTSEINSLLEEEEASKNILPPDSEPGHYDVTNNSAPSSNSDTTSNIRIPSPIPVRSGVPLYVTTNGFNDSADISVCVSVLDPQGVQVKYQLFKASKNNFGSSALWLPTTENISILVYVQGAKKVGMTMADVCVSYEAGAEFEPYKPESGLTVRTEALNPEALKMFAPLYGKTVVNFGDSIFGKRRPPDDISTEIARLTGATVHNCGFGGCRMATHSMTNYDAFSMYRLADAIVSGDWTYQDAGIADTTQSESVPSYFSEGLAILKGLDFKKVDIVTIAYGTNDFTAGVNIDNESNAYDTATFAGALRHSVEALLTAYPHLKIFVCSQTYRFWMDASNVFTDDSDTHMNADSVKLTDFVAKTEDVAKEYHLPYINNYDIGMNRFNRGQYFPENDGTHPLTSGCHLIAAHIVKELF